MNQETLLQHAKNHLHRLCSEITDRSVGSEGNRQATAYFSDHLKSLGWQVQDTLLNVMDWKSDGASLRCGPQEFEVFPSPYSLGGETSGELLPVSTMASLQSASLAGKIVMLHGDIAREQIMPKNFVFYNPEEHQQLVAALEKSRAGAIVCATGFNPALAGGVYPFPMFEDGDFDIPSVFMKDTEGEKLLRMAGQTVKLTSKAMRIPETAYNIIGSKSGHEKARIVVSAHIDAKQGSPGAIDNATGVTVLMLLAELLGAYAGQYTVELAAFNGEDYYSAPGQMKYMEQHQGDFSDVLLNINIDGAGYKDGLNAFSPMSLSRRQKAVLDGVMQNHPTIHEGAPWYQGDHGMFLQAGRPAIAVTSQWFLENLESQDITHTPKDQIGIVNEARLAEIALAIRDLIQIMGK